MVHRLPSGRVLRLGDRVGGKRDPLSPSAHETLLLASAAARPTWALLRRLGRVDVEADVVEAAELGIADAGHDGIVRFTHPLLSATLYSDASPERRRAAHALLATAAPELVERARHLALATPDEDTRRGGVVVIHHMPGYDRATKEITRRFAELGYDAICPNLHWRAFVHRENTRRPPRRQATTLGHGRQRRVAAPHR